MISKRSSLLLFISEVRADPISVESANPSSYRDVHPGLLLILCCLLPKANCASMSHNLQPDRKLTFPFSQTFTQGPSFPKCIQQNAKHQCGSTHFPVVSVIDVFCQCSGLGELILDNLWGRSALPQMKTHLKSLLGCQKPRSYSAGSFVWIGPPENQKIHTKVL